LPDSGAGCLGAFIIFPKSKRHALRILNEWAEPRKNKLSKREWPPQNKRSQLAPFVGMIRVRFEGLFWKLRQNSQPKAGTPAEELV
jgi:hypothetical protein